jgi:hypothetical protein
MSNHGKESTNEKGVNIDEMQMKIDMGKLITAHYTFPTTAPFQTTAKTFPSTPQYLFAII